LVQAKYDPELIAANQIAKIIMKLPEGAARRRMARWVYDKFGNAGIKAESVFPDMAPEYEIPKRKGPETLSIPFAEYDVCRHGTERGVKCFACEAEAQVPTAKILAHGSAAST
jgi:hypothetical protein